LVPRVGRETIRILLADREFKPWREKHVVAARSGPRVRAKNGGCTGGLRTPL
jgi:hypothetical protein